MSSFRGLGHSLSHSLSHSLGNGGDRDRDCLSLTVPLNPYIGCPTVSATGSAGAGPAEVRLAGVDTKEKMYEPKQRKKLVRVLTVVAYLFFVSLAAAMLSLYYVFLWNPKGAPKARHLIPPTDEQLRVQEQAVLRDLQRIQDQRRYNEMMRQREREREQVLALQMVQDLPWTSTPQPDYADFTENVEDDDMYTMQPPPLPVFRHHGATGAGVDLEDADNVIPAAPPRPRPPSGSSEEAEVSRVYGGNGHAALRHSSMHSLHSLRGPRAHA